MRHIQKTSEPQEFSDWKALANENWQPSYDDLSGKTKKSVYASLLREQGHICCYCERELMDNDYHIEHLNPQFLKAGDDLDYSNFLCSCLRDTEKGKPLHCGMQKEDKNLSINPLQPDCQSKFKFTGDGGIEGIDADANSTIEILGLDIPKLNDFRKQALAPFFDKELTEQERENFIAGYLQLCSDGKYNPFISAVAYVFRERL